MVRSGRVAALVAGVVGLASPGVAEPSVSILPLGFSVSNVRAPGSRVAALIATTDALRDNKALSNRPLVVVWGADGGAALALIDGIVTAFPLGRSGGDLAALEGTRGAAPGTRAQALGALNVSLVDPSSIYPHEALGTAVHPTAIAVSERRPVAPGPDPKPVPITTAKVEAGPGAVFEDLEARLADLDGDGVPEVVTVKSYKDRGSALAVLGRRDGRWSIVAETPPAGEPKSWLNPAGIADFIGSGRPQIAIVRTPHLAGMLELWSLEGGALVKRGERAGYSNHAFGQAAQDLAAIVDLEGDGRPELALPTLDRRAVAILSMTGGIVEKARIALPAAALTGVAALGSGRDTHILVGLDDGRVADIRP